MSQNLAIVLAFAALALLVEGCSPQAEHPGGEIEWARAALERNPELELVATDSDSGVLTVRSKKTGEVKALKLSELAAVPVADLQIAKPTQAAASADNAPNTPASAPAPEPPLQTAQDEKAPAAASTPDAPAYTIQREDGRVRVSGPGVSIVSERASAPSGSAAAATALSNIPIVCEGHHFLHLNDRDIHTEGTAVIARDGCELHITNSRISATDVGLQVENAVVHLSNSTVEGKTALDISGDSTLYSRSSGFRGTVRRQGKAQVQDQGGTQWR